MSGILLVVVGGAGASVPGAPTIGTATQTGSNRATVTYTAPASDGGSVITSYTATSSPGGITGTLTQAGSGTITVTGLTTGTAYTFTVTATNAIGTSPASAASGSVTPTLNSTLYSSGRNFSGELGINLTTYARSSPVQVGGTTWTSVLGGLEHFIGVRNSGRLYTWGKNASGQLGLGDTTNRSSPTQVGALTTWSNNLAAGGYTSGAITTSGALWVWGRGDNGSLGINNTTGYSSPKAVGALTWTDIKMGQTGWTAGITSGKLYTWGGNNQGQLGQNDTINRSSPVQVGSSAAWTKLGGCSYTPLALQTNALFSWGATSDGQAGHNDTVIRSSPVQISGTWISINNTGTGSTGAAINSENKLFTWGRNGAGQCALNNTINRSSPVQVGLLSNWAQVSVTQNAAAIKTDATWWTWGYNEGYFFGGSLAQNDKISRSSPVQVGSSTFSSVAAAGETIIART